MTKLTRTIAAALALAMAAPAVAHTPTRDGYVLMFAGKNSSTMSGSIDDYRRAKTYRNGQESLLYVRRDGAAYVVRDAATLAAAEEIFRPQQLLGARQAELGAQQAALGSRQAALGAQQARLGMRQADASPRQQLELGRQQDALGRQQQALGAQQEPLGRQQETLGREQERLGREAQAKLGQLFDAARARGLATRVD